MFVTYDTRYKAGASGEFTYHAPVHVPQEMITIVAIINVRHVASRNQTHDAQVIERAAKLVDAQAVIHNRVESRAQAETQHSAKHETATGKHVAYDVAHL